MSFELTYAPKQLADIVISDSYVVSKLDAYITQDTKRPLLLHGGYGVGKTSIANLLPDAIEGRPAVVNMIKATDFKTAADVASQFKANPFTGLPCFSINDGQKRQYLISNELSITENAAKVLVDVFDDIQEHVQIIFTTNHLQSIYGALRSRCTILEIKPALAMDWLVRAQFIMKSEGLVMDDQLLLKIIEDQLKSEHDHRKLLQLLEQVVWQCRNGVIF